ncbi:hypothetical protein, partial [Escherichia coli]|uniref:hypothetical protein n=1 Tax=Escherichia coli TaxID=562 RepID=UPI001BDB91F3
ISVDATIPLAPTVQVRTFGGLPESKQKAARRRLVDVEATRGSAELALRHGAQLAGQGADVGRQGFQLGG